MNSPTLKNLGLLDIKRLIALTDGVYGVALTLLVLDLKPAPGSANLVEALRQFYPRLFLYIIVFGSVVGYWTIHHRIFQLVHHGDGRIILLSLLNLLFVTLYPVAVSFVGAFPHDPLTIVGLSLNSLLYCWSASAVYSYISKHPYLLYKAVHFERLERMAQIMLFIMIGMAFSILFAFFNIYIAYAVWILCVPIAMLVERISYRQKFS